MLKFIVWDVQHGNAVYMVTPGGQHIAIDLGTGSCGNSGFEFNPILHLKYKSNVKQLDGLIITHPHRDHLDDILNFDELSPRVIRRPRHLSEEDIRSGNRKEDAEKIDKYLEINARYSSPVKETENPFLPQNNGGVRIETYYPNSCATSNLNNHSLVNIISYEDNKMLIPGDNEPPSWNELLAREGFIQSIHGTDILLAPHHGRQSAFSSDLFNHINPYLTIISDGSCETTAVDSYGKKSKGWLVAKRSGGSEERKCVTTRSDGVIVVEFWKKSDGQRYIGVTID